ncbi:MAG: hypothetical protein AVDCRST_MAG02-2234 [uncultured Rubrobacteraceae bacterium]|uniref:Uncharacterized protein n=1 Tax=uncultured Rubrobacteraceae bacterium TaxID=349277 RepID=A0A6J4R0H1_9ACTN|nr:MAG: hypothetical protein AVDCRST_MAG02-2234 [uncultured Rubrobacteraceae bacterium]
MSKYSLEVNGDRGNQGRPANRYLTHPERREVRLFGAVRRP